MSYDPNRLYPGGTEPKPQYVGTPAPTMPAGWLGAVAARYYRFVSRDTTYVDPALLDFLQRDVSRLISIASAAQQWAAATNAESSRQAAERLHAALRAGQ